MFTMAVKMKFEVKEFEFLPCEHLRMTYDLLTTHDYIALIDLVIEGVDVMGAAPSDRISLSRGYDEEATIFTRVSPGPAFGRVNAKLVDTIMGLKALRPGEWEEVKVTYAAVIREYDVKPLPADPIAALRHLLSGGSDLIPRGEHRVTGSATMNILVPIDIDLYATLKAFAEAFGGYNEEYEE